MRALPGSRFSDGDIKEAYEIFTSMAGGPSWPAALTPKRVLDLVLADPRHPLRKHLELDQRKAAYQYWLTQVRTLMSAVRVSVRIERAPAHEAYAKVLYTLPKTKEREGGYRPVQQIVREEEERGVLTRSRLSHLKQWATTTRNLIAALDSRDAEILKALYANVQAAIVKAESALSLIENDSAAE